MLFCFFLQIDLTGQVCSDSIGTRIYSGRYTAASTTSTTSNSTTASTTSTTTTNTTCTIIAVTVTDITTSTIAVEDSHSTFQYRFFWQFFAIYSVVFSSSLHRNTDNYNDSGISMGLLR